MLIFSNLSKYIITTIFSCKNVDKERETSHTISRLQKTSEFPESAMEGLANVIHAAHDRNDNKIAATANGKIQGN